MISFPRSNGLAAADAGASAPAKTRIYIVDDHPIVRHGLTLLINGEPDLVVCGNAGDAARAFDDIMRLRPEIAVVDLSLNGSSGLHLIKSIKSLEPCIGVIVLSIHDESSYGLRAIAAGARAYLRKGEAIMQVLDAIRRLRGGGMLVDGSLSRRMPGRIHLGTSRADPDLVSELSDRELEVVDLIGRGCTTREIATRLHVSVKTIETHRLHVKRKLQLSNATQLVPFCVRRAHENEAVPTSSLAGSPPVAQNAF